MSGIPWPEDRSDFLREHWGTMPASQISEILFGTVARKNAVIGRAHRMRLGAGYGRPQQQASDQMREAEAE